VAKPFFTLEPEEVIRLLDVDPKRGLSEEQVALRREKYGENRLADDAGAGMLSMLTRQFTDVMIIVLLIAAIVAGLIGEAIDAIAILIIVLLNGVVGFVQEYRAERALQALQELSAPHVNVLRAGEVRQIAEADLVPGDIVLLEAGNVVPADLRVIETTDLTVDEAALTGESLAVVKQSYAQLALDAPLGDRSTMAHKGTHVTSGRARCVAVRTGDQTELGRIAELMRGARRPMTPLQRRLAQFGRRVSVAVLLICAVVFLTGLARGEEPLLMLLTAVSLAVAAIPEALPAVVTIALALGAKRMVRRKALVRRLPAVETLGSVTVICCDKTGTLTQNTMHAERFVTPGHQTEKLSEADLAVAPWRALLRAMELNNDAKVDPQGRLQGDPTEVAILEAARDADPSCEGLSAQWKRIGEFPFDAARRRMTTLHAGSDMGLVVVKGAPETILPLCKYQRTGKGREAVNRKAALQIADEVANSGYRMLAFAEKKQRTPPSDAKRAGVERDLTFLGFVGLADPPRPGVENALASCVTAGIAVVMITGDHPTTARAIARRLGIPANGDGVVTGAELQHLSDEARSEAAAHTSVYARVSPEQKVDIVEALQARGEFVAMTGDGVNDAPALKRADIGVAMGQKGTDVAREAADIVLLDDDFATIVAAVREGRRIYDNIRKFIKYTMTSNSGEIWTIFLAPFLGLPLPLLPIQILWINLVTDGLPGLALSVEPEEPDIMEHPPRPPGESVFAHGVWQHMIWVGLLIGGLSLGAQAWAYHSGSQNWQTVVFCVLTLSQLVHALSIRSDRESLFTIGLLGNRPLLAAVVLSLGLQLAIIYVPPLQFIFRTTGLAANELLVVLTLPWVVLVGVEIEKWLVRRGLIYRDPRRGR
jgi:Ca2+-transporting ATPase